MQDVEHRERQRKERELWVAASEGAVEKVIQLIAQGIHPACRGQWGLTPLMAACHWGHLACVEALIPNGAMEARNYQGKQWALGIAMAAGHADCAKALLDAGARLDWRDCKGRTALGLAAAAGKVDCVKLGLERGMVATARDHERRTPLMLAAMRGHVDCIRELSAAGRPGARGKHHMTALMWAAAEGRFEAAKALLGSSNPLAVNENGRCALALAAAAFKEGANACVGLLATTEAAALKDHGGRTPIVVAIEHGRWANAKTLLAFSDPRQKHGRPKKTLAQLAQSIAPRTNTAGAMERDGFVAMAQAAEQEAVLRKVAARVPRATRKPRL